MKVYIANGQPFMDKKNAKRHLVKGQKVIKRKIPDITANQHDLLAINGVIYQVEAIEHDTILADHSALLLKSQFNPGVKPQEGDRVVSLAN